ncbi:MAG: hypothetical protein IJ724_06480 [Muribaculaceae bacterium]|nr:hypothetical protein [Muribaculaceae bacterium]MBR1726281.1 hypothetical protein [Muribaculaceae bacterium]
MAKVRIICHTATGRRKKSFYDAVVAQKSEKQPAQLANFQFIVVSLQVETQESPFNWRTVQLKTRNSKQTKI